MKIHKRLLGTLAILAVALFVLAAPIVAQQPENPPAQPPAQDQPRDTPPPSDRPSETQSQQAPSYQQPSDTGVAENPTRADTGLMTWGVPILTLLVGFALGFAIGNSRTTTTRVETRQDRAA